jgi:hypothetical protein
MPSPRHLSLLMLLLAMAAFAAQAQTHERPAGDDYGPPGAASGEPRSERTAQGTKGPPIRELTELLGLDQQQTASLDTALRDRHQQMQEMRQRAEEQRKATMSASDDRLRKLLTPEQFGKFKQWEAQHRPPPRGMSPGDRHGHDGERGPPPPRS